MKRMHQCEDVAGVLRVFDEFKYKMKPLDLGAAWNLIGRLVALSRQSEQMWLQRYPEMLGPLLERTEQDMRRLPAHSLAKVTHGLAKVWSKSGWQPRQAVWVALAEAASLRVAQFNPQDLAMIAWAFATAGHQAPALFEALAVEAAPRLEEFNPQNLASIAWTFATVGHQAPALFDALAVEAFPRLEEFNPQNLASIAWAYAVVDMRSQHLFGASSEPFAELCAAHSQLTRSSAQTFTDHNLAQLHQWSLWHQEIGKDSALPLDWRERCFKAFMGKQGRPSRLQEDVVGMLASLDMVVSVEEQVLNTSGYRLDAVVTLRTGQKVGVEVDGPNRFVGRSQQPTGGTMIKRRQLVSVDGCCVVSVPYWEIVYKSKDARAAYLEHELHLMCT